MKEIKKCNLVIRVTEAEKQDIDAKAAGAGLPPAEYIRRVLAQTRLSAQFKLEITQQKEASGE